MCGIAGLYAPEQVAPEARLAAVEAMCRRMAARGPDAHSLLAPADGLVLGHRRLSVIDLDARSNQPMSSADGRFVIVFNGEIYNYRELRRELLAAGELLRTGGDTEVLLALYARHGREMLARLRGMFALAIWDARESSLWLARDPHGIKPLYYAAGAHGFSFASQVKALLASGLLATEASGPGLAGFYLWGSVPEPWTTHAAIQALPAGHWLEVRAGRAGAPRCWYDVRQHWQGPELRCSAQELAARVQAAVVGSVRAHRVADVPLSVFLSGGVDSGAITGLLAAEGAAVEGITLGFAELEGGAADEVPGARAIARQYGVRHHVRRVTRARFEAELPRILDAMDQPSIDGINTWFASQAAAERGYKVVLSGVGGDELFAGYASFERLPRALRLTAPLRRAPAAASLIGAASRLAGALGAHPKLRFAWPALATLEGAYQLERGLFSPAELAPLLGESEARVALEALGDFAASRAAALARDATAGVALLESTRYLRNQLLRDSDWASMAHSLELRTPLVDSVLLEALAPLLAQFRHGAGKSLLAQCPPLPLPAQVTARRKSGFSVPMAVWCPEPELSPRREPWARRWARYVAARWLA